MTASLASAFRSGNGRKIKWNGRTVYSVAQLHVKDGDAIVVTRKSASSTRAQALKVAVDSGDLRANGILMPTAAIWTHTAPDQVRLDIVGRRVRSVDIWNSWSHHGVDSSWLGNAGMLIEQDDAAHTLRCSDGLGEPGFDDLVVTIGIQRG